jgi:glycosyltransferase
MDSVLGQSHTDIEYLIIDGGSTDGTLDLIKANAKKHQQIQWVSERDKGIYDALNKGIAMATGAIIGFVHSDDYLADPEVISNIAKEFQTSPVDGVYGDLHYVKSGATHKVVRNWKSQAFNSKLLRKGWMPAHPTLFLKADVYKTYGVFDLQYEIAADYDFVLRIFQQQHLKFKYLNTVITKMRVGGASNKSLKNLIKKSTEDYKALKKNKIPFPIVVLCYKNGSKLIQWINT